VKFRRQEVDPEARDDYRGDEIKSAFNIWMGEKMQG
jgi:hypothetical protein